MYCRGPTATPSVMLPAVAVETLAMFSARHQVTTREALHPGRLRSGRLLSSEGSVPLRLWVKDGQGPGTALGTHSDPSHRGRPGC